MTLPIKQVFDDLDNNQIDNKLAQGVKHCLQHFHGLKIKCEYRVLFVGVGEEIA